MWKFKNCCKLWWDNRKAKKRGEQRTHSDMLVRGRVYAKIEAKVYRAAEKKWYDLGRIS